MLYLSWKAWWQKSSLFQRWTPVCLLLLFLALHGTLGGIRSDHFLISAVIGALYYSGPKGHHLFCFLMPLLLILIIYDAQQYFAPLFRGTVHIQEPHELEMAFFAVGEMTPSRWLQAHTHPFLDAITGFAYLCFVPTYVLMAGYLYFYLPYRQRESSTANNYRQLGQAMMLSFLVITLLGYATHLIYPAAPPWYVDQYGFEFVAEAPPEAAGAARFDRLVGLPIFEAYYGKNTNVFGAIPSLHCGQTFLALYFAFLAGKLRILNGLIFVVVFFGSVYLNHHYVIDGLMGIFYAVIVGWVASRILRLQRSPI